MELIVSGGVPLHGPRLRLMPNVFRLGLLLLGYHFDTEGGGVAFKIEFAGER